LGGRGVCLGNGCGTVFRLNKKGAEFHSFDGADGTWPEEGLAIIVSRGAGYGTTYLGGDTSCYSQGCGTVFKLNSEGKETVLHEFSGAPDGEEPKGLLVADTLGNLYGTTTGGGASSGYGTVFEISAGGAETILHSFAGPPEGGGDGAFPYEGVVRDSAGNLYGTTALGGAYGSGVVYKLDASSSETLLYSFSGGDGANPGSLLLLDSQGNLYGTTSNGGNAQCGGTGCGVVFELSPQSGGGWIEKTLYAFCSLLGCTDGEGPGSGQLARDAGGNLYGTTYFGGAYRNCDGDACGVVFKLSPSGEETVLHSFTGGADGATPATGITADGAGYLYGTAENGGDNGCNLGGSPGCGTVFKLNPN
jgi:uncharacterized repeat protein (TIGR03803 family)